MRVSSRITEWYLGTNNTKEREVPKKGSKRFLYMLTNHLGELFVINLLFLLCCLPLITIPASLCALNRYIMKMYRTGYGYRVSDFVKEFRQEVIKCLPFGLGFGLAVFYAVYLLSMSLQFEEGLQKEFMQGMGLFCLFTVSLLSSYLFLLKSMLELTSLQALKNACILMLCEWKADLLLILIGLVAWGSMLALFPYSIVIPFLGIYAVRQLAVITVLNPVIERRILLPYERQNEYKKGLQ